MIWYIVVCVILFSSVSSENVGWNKYFVENIDEFHDIPLKWEGEANLPPWMKGTYVRNGPARISFNSTRRVFTSWLDGFAKLHSFKMDGNKVLFSGKMLEVPNYLESVAAGELTPQMTLNPFATQEEEWTTAEMMVIGKKMLTQTAFDNSNPALWRIGPASVDKGGVSTIVGFLFV